ncbi:MAG: tyrosine-type recombinase/integrase, partial [Vicinamibacterales bacterium]
MRDETAEQPRKPRGRHPDKRLTWARIKALRTPGRYADGGGLYVLVDPLGAKRWVLRVVIAQRRCDLGLGGLSTVSLAEARDEAARLRKVARRGGDPMAERRASRTVVPTFRDAATRVHAAHAPTFKSLKHRAQWLASLEAAAFPLLGDRPVNTITPADVLAVLAPVWTKKPETARRIKQRMKSVLDWAQACGYRTGSNPVDGVAKALPKSKKMARHHAALPYAKVPAFLKALQCGSIGPSTRLALEFLILTASRTSEVLQAQWDEIDEDGRTWTVPAERMKAGRPHRVPLSDPCMEILTEARALADGGPYIFAGRTPRKPLSNMALAMA